MKIIRDDNKIMLSDDSRNIKCFYENGKLKGSGSRKYKAELQEEIANFIHTEIASDIDKISKGELVYGEREFASYSNSMYFNNNQRSLYYDVTPEELKVWQQNPVKYNKKLRDLSMYFYGQKGILARTYDLYRNQHDLESALVNDNPQYDETKRKAYESAIRKFDKGIYKKPYIRDIFFTAVGKGTCIGYIIGKSSNRFIQILDLDYYLPKRIINGRWQVEVDLSKFLTNNIDNLDNYPQEFIPDAKDMSPKAVLRQQPLEVRLAFERWSKPSKQGGRAVNNRYYRLNITKTFVIKINSEQDERLGRPFGMPAFDDLLHKDIIRKAEESIIDKIVNFMLVLKLGNGVTNKEKGLYEGTPQQRQQVYNAVKSVLNNDTDGLKLFGLPFWVDLEPVENNLELFDKSKYESIDSDISVSLGVQGIFGGQDTQTYASGELGMGIVYRNIFSIIEQIEENLFNYQYSLIVEDANITYRRVFSRSTITDNKTKIDVLTKLQDKGGSVKYLLDAIGIQFDQYLEQTMYEQDENGLDLHNIFVPYATSFTQSDGESGRPNTEGEDNKQSNETPKPE